MHRTLCTACCCVTKGYRVALVCILPSANPTHRFAVVSRLGFHDPTQCVCTARCSPRTKMRPLTRIRGCAVPPSSHQTPSLCLMHKKGRTMCALSSHVLPPTHNGWCIIDTRDNLSYHEFLLSMITRTDLLAYINKELQAYAIKDYCPNGLQIEGTSTIRKLITGVTVSERFIKTALAQQPDALLVHHGLFWHKQEQSIVGAMKRKIALLLDNNVNLFAYHLPLDVHPRLGNNAMLGAQLDVDCEPVADVNPYGILWRGTCKVVDIDGTQTAHKLHEALQHVPLHIQVNRPIHSFAWCTGAAQHFIAQAHALGVDAFISGEISEQTVHFAQENNIHYYAAGHYATERGGAQALGGALAQHFGIEHTFIDLPVPV